MKRILLTGMSGTGKSTVIGELAARGYRAIDMDEPGWSECGPDGDWIWREERIGEALAHEEGEVLFVSGCATNQVQFYPPVRCDCALQRAGRGAHRAAGHTDEQPLR